MGYGPLLERIQNRVNLDKGEGDIAYFHGLMLQLEFLTKLVVAAVVACVGEDVERHQYSLEHRLIRADSVGDWVDALSVALAGPPAQFIRPQAASIVRQLTERVGNGDWRHTAVQSIHRVAELLGLEQSIGAKLALRQFFQIGAAIRNRTRGHGATTSEQCGAACPHLAAALADIAEHLDVFRLPWVYLHRNLSGKFRVAPLLGKCEEFDFLKRSRDSTLANGVFVWLGQPVSAALVFSLDNSRRGRFE
jgi:hypothetical protein